MRTSPQNYPKKRLPSLSLSFSLSLSINVFFILFRILVLEKRAGSGFWWMRPFTTRPPTLICIRNNRDGRDRYCERERDVDQIRTYTSTNSNLIYLINSPSC